MCEVHPYNSTNPLPKGTRVLIIGTAPPERFSKRPGPEGDPPDDVRFFYGSQDNELWLKILPAVVRFQLRGGAEDRRQQMIAFLKLNRIWMHDVFQNYRRGQAGSSLDMHLELIVPADLKSIFAEHPTIEHVIFTGGRAERESCKHMIQQGIVGGLQIAGRMPRSQTIELRFGEVRRQLRLHAVPSPSAMTRRSGMTLAEKLEIYRQVFREVCPELMAV